jgi:mannose-6-phosphate isomerase-like protein (cupin superfamily)
LRVLEFWPEDPEVLAKLDGKTAFGAMGASDNVVEDTRHPFMHKTNTVDYAIVIEGEIDMLMDETSVHLKQGDVLIQRGTNHAWSNRGSDVCRIAFVLIDGVKE